MSGAQALSQPRYAQVSGAAGPLDDVQPAKARRSAAKRRRWWLPTIVASLLGGAATLALWASHATLGAVVTTGNFHFELGDFHWTSPTQGLSGQVNTLSELTLGDGDKLVVTQKIIGDFEGDNLNVKIGITWADLPPDWTATWRIEDAVGQRIAPDSGADVSLATDLVAPGLVVPGPATWQIVMTLEPNNTTVYGDPASPPHPKPFDLGPIIIAADQVRG